MQARLDAASQALQELNSAPPMELDVPKVKAVLQEARSAGVAESFLAIGATRLKDAEAAQAKSVAAAALLAQYQARRSALSSRC